MTVVISLKAKIRQAISDGVSAEESNAEITDRVMKVFFEYEPKLNENRQNTLITNYDD